MTKYYLSGPFDYKGNGWGFAHYSYGFVMDLFEKMLLNDGQKIDKKFSYPFRRTRVVLPENEQVVHISFLAPDVALVIPGAFNICVFAWEFDKLPNIPDVSKSFFEKEYVEALKQFDAVITLSTYAKKTLKKYGIKSYVLPSPIKDVAQFSENLSNIVCYPLNTDPNFYRKKPMASIRKSVQQIIDNTSKEKTFLYIFNPHDIRKNFGNLVTAFDKFAEENPDSALFLKITYTGTLDKLSAIAFKREFPSFPSTGFKNVYIIPSKLSDQDLAGLIKACGNYISPSRAEGQNLPLGEAMMLETLTISPDHTSMADYIDKDVSVVLESNEWEISKETHKYSEFWGLTWYNVSEDSILDAINRSVNLTSEDRLDIISKANKKIKKFASEKVILDKWNKIKKDLGIDN